MKILGGVELTTSINLNDYTDAGFYYCNSVNSWTNSPTTKACSLQVITSGNGVCQRIIENSVTSPKIYFRNYDGSVWGEWYREYTTADRQDITDLEERATDLEDRATSVENELDNCMKIGTVPLPIAARLTTSKGNYGENQWIVYNADVKDIPAGFYITNANSTTSVSFRANGNGSGNTTYINNITATNVLTGETRTVLRDINFSATSSYSTTLTGIKLCERLTAQVHSYVSSYSFTRSKYYLNTN